MIVRQALGLFNQFIFRSLARQKLRTTVTVLGISLGVAVVIAIRLANASSLQSFRAATDSVAGRASLQITGAAGRLDETLLARLDWLRAYGDVSPVIEGYALAEQPGAPSHGEFLHVLGIDILRDRPLRDYELLRLSQSESQPSARDFLLLLADPNAIVLTEKFARSHGISIGGKLALDIGDSKREFTVRGLLLDAGPARALDGRFALMDIAAAQWAFDRLGYLDRVDLKLKPGFNAEKARDEIASRLPAGLIVTAPDERYGQVEKMIAAFHFNLNALGSVALLVGLFLVYNTVSISVITRRSEVGMLRAVGLRRRTALYLFLSEAALFSIAGTPIGLLLGRLMSSWTVKATSATVNNFYLASAATSELSRQRLTLSEAALAFAVCLPLSLLAAALPAIEASRVQPVEAIRGSERTAASLTPPRRYLAISVLLAVAGYLLSLLNPIRGLPIFGYFSAVALMFAGAFLVPGALWLLCKGAAKAIPALPKWRVEAGLAAANLAGAIQRVSISVAALSVSIAMMIAVSIMIGSFRETVSYWIDQTLGADIYVKPITRSTTISDGTVSPEALDAIKSDPDVAAVDELTSFPATYQGHLITLAAGDFRVVLDHGRLMFKSPTDARAKIRQALGGDIVTVSESFSLLFNKQPGDTVELPTPGGAHSFQVVAVFYDYSSNRGTVVMGRAVYKRLYLTHSPDGAPRIARPTNLAVYLRNASDDEPVATRLSGQLSEKYQLTFATSGDVRREAVRIFDSTFAITYALETIAIIVAAFGVLSTLITLIIERRREIAMLRLIGASRSQVRRMIVGEAVLIAAVSQAVGLLIGVALSLVLVYVINVQSFGWTIQYHFPFGFVVQSTLALIIFAALAGLYPAARALKMEAVSAVREE